MSTQNIAPELQEELELLARQQGCELLSLDLSGNTLRIVLDREDGTVGIEDCASVSRQASALLDAHDFGTRRYTLEVSSPGLDRPLYGPRDYRRFAGQLARITFSDPETGSGQTLVGRLEVEGEEGEDDSSLKVALANPQTGELTPIPLDHVRAARLEVDL